MDSDKIDLIIMAAMIIFGGLLITGLMLGMVLDVERAYLKTWAGGLVIPFFASAFFLAGRLFLKLWSTP